MMKCRICNSKVQNFAKAKILERHIINYYLCLECGFLQTEEPYWLEEAYEEPINIYDTGILSRNILFSEIAATIIYFLFKKEGRFLDYAGGYGIFTRLMRDIGFDFYWYDPYSTNLMARGFELIEGTSNFELVTCFEVLEHLVDPLEEIGKTLRFSDTILFSTTLLPVDIPKPCEWSYYGLEYGQHISFYSFKTLQFIARSFGCNLYSNRTSVHLLTKHALNSFLFKLLLKFSHHGLVSYVKSRMKSKTEGDSTFMILLKKRDS